ncbi:MAG: DUF4296 domain-containing protein [Bacteroidota bacterium]
MRLFILILLLFCISCGEKLMEKPEDLIPKEKMVDVLMDMALMNAAKSTNISVLKEHHIDPTGYVFKKHGIDSTTFVESDLYYASLPAEYEAIYEEIGERLEKEKKKWEEAKKVSDSIQASEASDLSATKKVKTKKSKDSPP